jgi:predicted lactoylglutathione lyase
MGNLNRRHAPPLRGDCFVAGRAARVHCRRPPIRSSALTFSQKNRSMRCRFGGPSIVFKQELSPFARSPEIGIPPDKERAMSKMIFVSLPVTDLKASVAFYQAIGFRNNPQFSDETAACMVWSETISFMLLTHAKWRTFTSRPIPPKTSSEVMLALSCESRDAVDAINAAAAANGGTADINPVEDHGFMYARDLADPDGHALGAMWMDMSAIASGHKPG